MVRFFINHYKRITHSSQILAFLGQDQFTKPQSSKKDSWNGERMRPMNVHDQNTIQGLVFKEEFLIG
ncbi:MAG: hypothetical protein D6732_12750 [Methanobacteriota archaeon]|nr:MAG: hypothetical protein D6732_12750 [Euryarchaeota archaeon]